MESAARFSPNIELVLRDAGWFPERKVNEELMDSWLIIEWKPWNSCPHGYSKIFPAAWRVLNEFGGLEIRPFRASIGADAELFTLNPTLVAEDNDFDQDWHLIEWLLGETLFPLGLWHGYIGGALVINSNGQIFLIYSYGNSISESIYPLGDTIEKALETLILGILPETLDLNKNNESSVLVHKIVNRIEEREMMKGGWG